MFKFHVVSSLKTSAVAINFDGDVNFSLPFLIPKLKSSMDIKLDDWLISVNLHIFISLNKIEIKTVTVPSLVGGHM